MVSMGKAQSTNIMQSLAFIFSDQENCNVKIFATYGHLAGWLASLTLIIIKTHIFHASQKSNTPK